MPDKTRFKNRVALITGAGSETGIGFAAARILGKAGSGVAITSTTNRIYERANELKGDGIEVKAYIADLMNRNQVKKLAGSVFRDFSRIDILINNAGMVQVGKEEAFLNMVDLAPGSWGRTTVTNYNNGERILKQALKPS